MSLFKEKKSFFGRLSEKIGDVLMARAEVDEDLMDELEEILITSDIGMDTTIQTGIGTTTIVTTIITIISVTITIMDTITIHTTIPTFRLVQA